MSYISEFSDLPEISFDGGWTLGKIQQYLEAAYGAEMEKLGESGVLAAADPFKLIIMGLSALSYQMVQLINVKGKQNFLRYATGAYLDQLATFKKITRKGPTSAEVTMRFSMTSVRNSATPIPAGTRVSTENGIYFMVKSYAEIPIGEQSIECTAIALAPGSKQNGIAAGLINRIVDPLPYIAAVVNVDASEGGTDTESDEDLTRRVYLAPSGYSVAGPSEAYEYFARSFRGDVSDVQVTSPAPCEVEIIFLLEGGVLPDEHTREEMLAYLSDETIRPLADKLTIAVPEEVEYSIQLTYYIAKSKESQALNIQSAVNTAVEAYKKWQRQLGRDINPTELIARIRNAGAKRAAVVAPEYLAVEGKQLPKLSSAQVTYGGLEDD